MYLTLPMPSVQDNVVNVNVFMIFIYIYIYFNEPGKPKMSLATTQYMITNVLMNIVVNFGGQVTNRKSQRSIM